MELLRTVVGMAPPPGGAEGGGAGMLVSLLPIAFIIFIMWLFLFRPQAQKQKEHQKMVASVEKNDRVVTAGGIHGVVANVDQDTVTVKIATNSDLRVKFSRSAISRLEKAGSGDVSESSGG